MLALAAKKREAVKRNVWMAEVVEEVVAEVVTPDSDKGNVVTTFTLINMSYNYNAGQTHEEVSEQPQKQQRIEWNNFYPNQGHNIADSHAGHAKKQVRLLEQDFNLTRTIDNVEVGISKLSATNIIRLSPAEILENDEPKAVPIGDAWIKKYFHFIYDNDGKKGPNIVRLYSVQFLLHVNFMCT